MSQPVYFSKLFYTKSPDSEIVSTFREICYFRGKTNNPVQCNPKTNFDSRTICAFMALTVGEFWELF